MDQYAEAEEKTYIAALMNSAKTLDNYPLPPEWFTPKHQPIVAAAQALHDEGRPANPMEVLARLSEEGGDAKIAGRGADYLFDIYSTADLGSVAFCARRIAEAAQRRNLQVSVARIAQVLERTPDFDAALDMTAQEILSMQVVLDDPMFDRPIEGLHTLKEFLGQVVHVREWVIPHILKRQERAIFLAPPGIGKSTLARQAAILTAAGIHPFFPDLRIPPQRTLLVDLENPAEIVTGKINKSFSSSSAAGNVHIFHRPEGIDARSPQGARILDRVLAQVKPAIMFIGPLYKMARKGRDDWETVANDTARVLDRLRTKHDCALWIEHHMPKNVGGQMTKTPFGSSMWERWPEFGFIITPPEDKDRDNVYKLEEYRPGRDERSWPYGMTRNGTYPWSSLFNAPDNALLYAELREQRKAERESFEES